jgi:SAM-dependent methyltransferase
MEDSDYAYEICSRHLGRIDPAWSPGFVALELGCGDSLFSVLVAQAFGATRTYLVDTGPNAVSGLARYQAMAAYLVARGHQVADLSGLTSLDDVLAASNGRYLTEGLHSLREIPTSSVDFIWSHAVLEHVRQHEFLPMMREVRRVLRDTGRVSHCVDLRDHLQEGLHNLRFPAWMWETELMASSGFYTNRLSYSQMLCLFTEAGFSVERVDLRRWERTPAPDRSRFAPEFRGRSEDDLGVREFDVLLRP